MNSMYQILFVVASVTWLTAMPLRGIGQDFSGESDQAVAEESPVESDYRIKDHIRFGGNVGAQFGTVTFINLVPMVGYQINDRLMVGTRAKYQYLQIRGFSQLSSHVYGGSAFGRAFLSERIYGHLEYEVLRGYFDPYANGRTNIPFLFAGVGYLYPVSNHVSLSVTALYELLRRQYALNLFPQINVGVVVGL